MNPWILLPATLIMFRETFVSGLREFLGDTAGTLAVTKLAKWKTAAQMTAIAVLFSTGAFQTYFEISVEGMDAATIDAVMLGELPDGGGIIWKLNGAFYSWWIGIILLWAAMGLTVITGVDYLRKSMPYLREQ
jgi:CDP-diacylglycerol--glycerol-3-phosphate 3-phosphatidyltransferase